MNSKVLVAMSGGVDSAVAAFLLKQQGFDVTGANMRFWQYEESTQCATDSPAQNSPTKKRHTSCCSPEDLGDAERSALGLVIPFYALKMEQDFRQKVIEPFIDDYRGGKTPNPCVHCNTFIKFGEFFQKADLLKFEKIATGHYAKVQKNSDGRYAIYPAKDVRKDQAYYLYGLSQDSLSKTEFPLADLTKDEVRKIAMENHIPVAQKAESQEICFIPDNDYRAFLQREGLIFQSGYIKDTSGKILAKHDGKEKFTIGQRKGLNTAVVHPLYVLKILQNGDVIVGTKEEMDVREFFVGEVLFQGLDPQSIKKDVPIKCTAQVRYNSKPVSAQIEYSVRESGAVFKVTLLEPAFAITPGQACVFYHDEEGYILAGGKILRETL